MTTSNGLLLIDKPVGLTSHDVVARVRKIVQRAPHRPRRHARSHGHGTAGDRRRPVDALLRFAQSQTKRYTGTVRFGVATDSLDADGEVVGDVERALDVPRGSQ